MQGRGICTKEQDSPQGRKTRSRLPGRACGRSRGTPKEIFRDVRAGHAEVGSPPISRVLSRRLAPTGQSFLLAPRYRDAPAAYPGALRAASPPPYLALPRMGFAVPSVLPRPRWALTRRDSRPARDFAHAPPRTVSPLPDPSSPPRGDEARPSAVCSLLHFPSPHGARPLAGILPCGARTFLHAREHAQRLPGELPGADYTGDGPLGAAGRPQFSARAAVSPHEKPTNSPMARSHDQENRLFRPAGRHVYS